MVFGKEGGDKVDFAARVKKSDNVQINSLLLCQDHRLPTTKI